MPHKITPTVDQNQWLNRLNTQLNKPTNQNSVKVPKDVKSTNKKMSYCPLSLFLGNRQQEQI